MGCLKLAYYKNKSPLKVVQRSFEVNGKSGASGYRYGFDGKELDNEINVEGGALDFGARVCDSRLGRFLSVNQLSKQFPSESNYSFVSNCPIAAVEKDGKFTFLVLGLINTGLDYLFQVAENVIFRDKKIDDLSTYTDVSFWGLGGAFLQGSTGIGFVNQLNRLKKIRSIFLQ